MVATSGITHKRTTMTSGRPPASQYEARPIAIAVRVSSVGVIVSVNDSVKMMRAPIGQKRRSKSHGVDRSNSSPASVALFSALRTDARAKKPMPAQATKMPAQSRQSLSDGNRPDM